MNTKFRLGILINPVAGIGGPAGLKGSDAPETQRIAKERGVESKVHARVKEVLALLSDEADRIELILPSSQMGEIALPADHSFSYSIAYFCAQHTTADDTVRAANALCERGLDLLLFAGGDGTARDVPRLVIRRQYLEYLQV
jgi:predicted polyphosphate/ATP-dependent NAD kinase